MQLNLWGVSVVAWFEAIKNRFARNTAASLSINAVIGLVLLVVIIAALVPVAFGQFFSANTTGWDAGTVALWTLIPLAIAIVLVRSFIQSRSSD